jgi:hypothetical protein
MGNVARVLDMLQRLVPEYQRPGCKRSPAQDRR